MFVKLARRLPMCLAHQIVLALPSKAQGLSGSRIIAVPCLRRAVSPLARCGYSHYVMTKYLWRNLFRRPPCLIASWRASDKPCWLVHLSLAKECALGSEWPARLGYFHRSGPRLQLHSSQTSWIQGEMAPEWAMVTA